ncbi:MAG TPA: c-type cytochrome biogenesis protein CcmI [Hyphomicrobiales bacterium]|nr:c-type cytochrome biogenesis protein CcmI [Hyphomicrobiales bacterium]
MLLWYILGVMTGLALLPVFSLIGGRRLRGEAAGQDKQVYEDQLRSLEAEAEQGLIGEQELAAARVEISRRLLAAADRKEKSATPVTPIGWAMIAVSSAAVVVLVALGGYLALGRPDLVARAPAPAAPQQQTVPGQAEMAARLSEVQAQLRTNPDNGIAWEEAAALNFALGRYEEATVAYENAIRVLGETAQRLGDYGEAMTQANGSVVSDEAKAIFEKALALDPDLVPARFYLALADEQAGKFEEAGEAWQALLDDAPEGAFWKPLVEQRLAAVNTQRGAAPARPQEEPAAAPQPEPSGETTSGPSAEDMRSAQELPQEARDDMVAQMVAGLAERLEENGDDLDGWLMLMRSYMVLEQPEDAKEAADKARQQFAGDEEALRRIEEAEQALGI